MGLLDALLGGGSANGGLLDFLRQNGMNQNTNAGIGSNDASYAQAGAPAPMATMSGQPSPIFAPQQPSSLDNAQWPAGPAGAPMQANAQMAPAAIAAAPTAPQPAPPQAGDSGILSHIGAALQSIGAPGSLFQNAVGNPINALITGQTPADTARAQQTQIANVTARALIAKGVDPQIAIASVQPGNGEFLKTLVTQNFGPQTVTSIGEGYVADKNGKVTRAYTPEQKDNFGMVQTGEDGLGRKTFQKMNKATGDMTPLPGAAADSGTGGGLGDMNKTGADYLATVPKAQAGIMQGMVDGTIQPPSSFALAKPYWQAMLAGAKNLDPNFDANTWTSRHKMSSDIGASGNSSMGGILSNGKSSFKHLAEYTESAADLGNASHDFPGGSMAATAQNYLGNKVFAGSDTSAKIKAINDNLGHYGQESTKFYAGTGGGVEERMNALKEMNPAITSSEEMAAYAAKEKGLMLDRLREKEAQIRDVMGEAFLQKHPVFTPELQKDIARIDANVGKLRGQSASASAPKPGAYTWSPGGGVQPK